MKNAIDPSPLDLQSVQLKNGKTVNLRLLERRDVEGIWRNFNDVVEEKIYLPVYTPVIDDWEKNTWYQEMLREGNLCAVAEDPEQKRENRIVGQCTIESVEWEAAEHVGVLGIIIKNGYRNSGLGNNLIRFAIEHAKVRGKKKINLSTFETNQLGIALYKKCGFQIVGRYSRQYKIQKQYIDEILMEKWLE